MAGLLDRERIIAKPGFNRWLVPPGRPRHSPLHRHGLRLQRLLAAAQQGHRHHPARRLSGGHGLLPAARRHDLRLEDQHAGLDVHAVLRLPGLARRRSSAAGWSGPARGRPAWWPPSAGAAGSSSPRSGVTTHQLWLLWLGSGVIGGCGLGLGYISPVSTLIKWFPDRRGMATGMAIMGFGGGAMIGAPLADLLMKHYATPTSVGVCETFLTMGSIYFVGHAVRRVRLPGPAAGLEAGRVDAAGQASAHDHPRHVHVRQGVEDAAVLALWGVLCLNVSAGIGVIGMASPMIQEVFGGKLIDVPGSAGRAHAGAEGAGRDDRRGIRGAAQLLQHRRAVLLGLAVGLHRPEAHLLHLLRSRDRCSTPRPRARAGSAAWRSSSAIFCVILTMYGGGFATIPAYLADMFGTQFVGRHPRPAADRLVHRRHPGPGAGELHPRVPDRHGVPNAQAYNTTMYVLAGLLVVGLLLQPAGAAGGRSAIS